jgi:SagB-type dehydrogenase family enzyme
VAPFFSVNTVTDNTKNNEAVNGLDTITLPSPIYYGRISVEETLYKRRSTRSFANFPLTIREVAQLLWAAYGITEKTKPSLRRRLKTAPSAGKCYPLEIYLVVGKVTNLKFGVYKYAPEKHSLIPAVMGDIRKKLSRAAYNKEAIAKAPVSIVYSAVFDRTTAKYGIRGFNRYVSIDVGHSAQNVYLQAVSLKLATCAIGDFDDDNVAKVIPFSKDETPLYIMPCGKRV